MGVFTHFYLVLFGDNGVCVLCALTSVGALFFIIKTVRLYTKGALSMATARGDARKNKQDEFYTQLVDVEKELKHYREHFKNKIVFCNCDDPVDSNFFLSCVQTVTK